MFTQFAWMWRLRGKMTKPQSMGLQVLGLVIFFAVWQLLDGLHVFNKAILPGPWDVISSIPEIILQDGLVSNLGYSFFINSAGYVEAVIIAVPIGFLIGLFPFFRGTMELGLSAMRFLPLTAMIGIFILWFGIGSAMKIHFLAFGILVYLIPVVIQRVSEVAQVYVDTAKTIGATRWQIIRHVFFPDVASRLFDDIRVLIAVSWTYIIVAEMVNRNDGGVGGMIFAASRQSRPDKVFALLVIICVVGYAQDVVMKYLDKYFFDYKYIQPGK